MAQRLDMIAGGTGAFSVFDEIPSDLLFNISLEIPATMESTSAPHIHQLYNSFRAHVGCCNSACNHKDIEVGQQGHMPPQL